MNTLTPDTLLDITHEALLRNWDKLQQWAYEEHEREIILREMLAQLDKWLKNNRDTQFLLSAGSLSYFEKWWTGIEVNKAMWMRRYLEGGIRADDLIDKERKTQNAKQKKQEIEEYISDSRNYHNRKKRIQRIAIGIICVLLVTAVGGLIYSWDLKNKISVTSHSNAIATKAYRTLEKDPTLAFRLAEQAYKIAPEPLAKEVLMAAYGEMPFYQVLRGHTEPIVNAKYSSDGKLIITACLDNTIKLWNSNGKLIYSIDKHTPLVSGSRSDVVNFSPNNKFIVSAGDDSTARLWEVSSGKCLAVMKHKKAVSSAVFSPDGTKILTASADKTAKLWDLTGKELVVFKHKKWISVARFSFNGEKIFTASGDSTAKIWTKDGILIQILNHPISLRKLVVSNNDSFIITGASDMKFRMWKVSQNGKWILFKTIDYLKGQDRSITFSNDNKLFITSSDDNETRVWDYNGNEKLIIRGHSSGVWATRFSSDNKQILTASDDGTARLWDLSGTELMVLKGHTDQVLSANFSPDGNYVVTASGDKTARIWNIKPKENPVLSGHTAYVMDINLSPDNKNYLTAALDYTSRVWDSRGNQLMTMRHDYYTVCQAIYSPNNKCFITTTNETFLWHIGGKLIQKLQNEGIVAVFGNSFSHNGKMILVQREDEPKSYLWSINGSARKLYTIHHSLSAEFSPSDNYILSSDEDSTVKICLIPKEKTADTLSATVILKGHKGSVLGTWSPDGKNILTTSDDSTARIWDINGKCLQVLKGHTSTLGLARYSPDGKYVLIVSNDNLIYVWNNNGNLVSVLKGHNNSIHDANFSPDSKSIVTSSSDNSYRLWDLQGNELLTFTNHKATIRKAKFSPDRKYILTASDDHTARIMPVSVEMALDKINTEKVRGEVMELSKEELETFGIMSH